MPKEKKKEEKEDIYEKLQNDGAIIELYEKIRKEKDWEGKEARLRLPLALGQDPTRYALMPERGFRVEMEALVSNKISEDNKVLYEGFYDLLKNHSPEEIADLLESIPFAYKYDIDEDGNLEIKDENLKRIVDKDENLKRIVMHHINLTGIKNMGVEQYGKLLRRKFSKGAITAYAKLTLPDEGLKQEMEYHRIETKNYLIGELKKLKESMYGKKA